MKKAISFIISSFALLLVAFSFIKVDVNASTNSVVFTNTNDFTIQDNANFTTTISLLGAVNVSGFQIKFLYDASKFELVEVVQEETTISSMLTINDIVPGQIVVVHSDVDQLLNGNVPLFHITMKAIGTFEIGFHEIIVNDSSYNYKVSMTNGTTVSNVSSVLFDYKEVRYGLYGDVNGDGKVSIMDATQIRLFIAELKTFSDGQKILADVNGDGEITVSDVNLIQLFLAGRINSLIPETNNPNELKTCLELQSVSPGNYMTEGQVVAHSAFSFLIYDETGFVLVYQPLPVGINMNDFVKVSGPVVIYANKPEYKGTTETPLVIEPIEQKNYFFDYSNPGLPIDGSQLVPNSPIQFLSVEGTLILDGNYYNLLIENSSLMGSIMKPVSELEELILKPLIGKKIILVGFYAYDINQYASFMMSYAWALENPNPEEFMELGNMANALPEKIYFSAGRIVASTNRGFLMYDGTGFGYVFLGGPHVFVPDMYVQVKGKIGFYLNAPEYMHSEQNQMEIIIIENMNIPLPGVNEITGSNIFQGMPQMRVQMTGVFNFVSDKYYNITFAETTMKGTFLNPTLDHQELLKTLDGQEITFQAYIVYQSPELCYMMFDGLAAVQLPIEQMYLVIGTRIDENFMRIKDEEGYAMVIDPVFYPLVEIEEGVWSLQQDAFMRAHLDNMLVAYKYEGIDGIIIHKSLYGVGITQDCIVKELFFYEDQRGNFIDGYMIASDLQFEFKTNSIVGYYEFLNNANQHVGIQVFTSFIEGSPIAYNAYFTIDGYYYSLETLTRDGDSFFVIQEGSLVPLVVSQDFLTLTFDGKDYTRGTRQDVVSDRLFLIDWYSDDGKYVLSFEAEHDMNYQFYFSAVLFQDGEVVENYNVEINELGQIVLKDQFNYEFPLQDLTYSLFTLREWLFTDKYVNPIDPEEPEYLACGDMGLAVVDQYYYSEGLVVGKTSMGLLIWDETGFGYVFSKTIPPVNVGDYIRVKGAIQYFNARPEYIETSQYALQFEILGGMYYPLPQINVLQGVDLIQGMAQQRVQMTGIFNFVDNQFYNIVFDGATLIGSFLSPLEEDKLMLQALSGQEITFIAYVVNQNEQFCNMIFEKFVVEEQEIAEMYLVISHLYDENYYTLKDELGNRLMVNPRYYLLQETQEGVWSLTEEVFMSAYMDGIFIGYKYVGEETIHVITSKGTIIFNADSFLTFINIYEDQSGNFFNGYVNSMEISYYQPESIFKSFGRIDENGQNILFNVRKAFVQGAPVYYVVDMYVNGYLIKTEQLYQEAESYYVIHEGTQIPFIVSQDFLTLTFDGKTYQEVEYTVAAYHELFVKAWVDQATMQTLLFEIEQDQMGVFHMSATLYVEAVATKFYDVAINNDLQVVLTEVVGTSSSILEYLDNLSFVFQGSKFTKMNVSPFLS
jgi:hypothetical protein